MIAEVFSDIEEDIQWYSNSSSFPVFSERVYDAFIGEWINKKEAAIREHSRECRRRDLSALYRDDLPRFILIRKPVLRRFQPCWSSRRWRSVT